MWGVGFSVFRNVSDRCKWEKKKKNQNLKVIPCQSVMMDGYGWPETARCSVTYSNYDRTEGLLLREILVIPWRIESVRISSSPSFSLCVFHWPRSILHWTFSNFALALHDAPLFPLHADTDTHIHLLSRALIPSQTPHHLCYYDCVSHSLWSHILSTFTPFHSLHSLWHLSISFCPPRSAPPSWLVVTKKKKY